MRSAKHKTGKAEAWRPGQRARRSGIYEVVHRSQHRASQRGIMVRGQIFPECKQCLQEVRYILIEPRPHIREDEDFCDAGGTPADG